MYKGLSFLTIGSAVSNSDTEEDTKADPVFLLLPDVNPVHVPFDILPE